MIRRIMAVAMAIGWGVSVQAEGVALVLSNGDYDNLPVIEPRLQVGPLVEALEDMGFLVLSGSDLTAEEMRAQLAGSFEQMTREPPERVVVVLAGHFAHSQRGVWLMGRDSTRAGLALADGQGLRLDAVAEIAAMASDASVLWLALPGDSADFGPGLTAGLPAALDLPAGVAALRGPAARVSEGVRISLRPGTTLASVARADRAVSGEGALPARAAFLPEGFAPGARADARAFAAAQEADSEEGYLAYLAAFPNGLNAQTARAELERIRTAPDRIEAALFLTRDERRAIQRDLSILGYDTRGIDGIFGPGTRGAISSWQGLRALEETGFLDRDQIFALAGQAAERAAELEAEERAQREVQEREDRELWALTGAAGDAPGLRSYLERFPEGIFAGLAQERLEQFAAAERAAERDHDLSAWRRARGIDTAASYEAYLRDWPEGEFVENAQARLEGRRPVAVTSPPAPVTPPQDARPSNPRAEAAEAALNLPQPTRILIERRLARLGLDPGPVDGVFDAQSRQAIAQAQSRFDLVPTGYVNQDLLTMLLSNLFSEFFR
ncbi:MAG: hypothetical protein EA339_02540 [Rhodobacteraceae bacterium]|nr:MAG: hypothetical protein EA339_02540 [Paracoccaceae bacterium]